MLAFVDRLTKCAHFISTTSHCSAEERYLRSWEGNPQLEWLVILSFKHIKTTHFLTLLSLKINFWKPASIITYYTQLSMIKLAIFFSWESHTWHIWAQLSFQLYSFALFESEQIAAMSLESPTPIESTQWLMGQ